MSDPAGPQPPLNAARAAPRRAEPGLAPRAASEASAPEMLAVALSVAWVVVSVGILLILPALTDGSFDAPGFVMTLLAVFLPVAMIWVAATAARSAT